MNILALDLSLTRTGYAAFGTSGVLVPPRGQDRGPRRLAWFRESIAGLLAAGQIDLVVLEGYSMGGQRGSAGVGQMLGELGGVVRLLLHDEGVPFAEVPPSNLKKYATGKGNAPKAEVLVSAVRRLDYAGSDDNEADALWLLAMAMDQYGEGASDVPQAHRVALQKIAWPEAPTPQRSAA